VYCRANTLGLLALIANCLSFAVYLIIMQQFLARRAFPFSAFFAASVVGGVAIAVCAAPEVSQASPRCSSLPIFTFHREKQ